MGAGILAVQALALRSKNDAVRDELQFFLLYAREQIESGAELRQLCLMLPPLAVRTLH